MRIVEDVTSFEEELPALVLTIGSFDGVHLGHQRILQALIEDARERQGLAAVMTLRPHPREFFAPRNAPNILSDDLQKQALLEQMGVDILFYLPFTAEIAHMDRQDFLKEILLGRCCARKLIVGHDFAFGRGAEGNYEFLKEQTHRLNFEVREIPPLIIQGERVSSTLIREAILQGELDKTETFLGRRYAIAGEVISGRGMGVKLGFPTANVEPHNKTIPAHGVYVAEATMAGTTYPAAVNIGIAPTIRHEDMMIEVHILDFARNITGERIEVTFHKRLRPEAKYDSLDALIAAIQKDVDEVRQYFS